MKNIFLSVLFLSIIGVVQAQEKDKFRVGWDFGYAFGDQTKGISVSMEPKYNIKDNMNVGLRLNTSLLFKNLSISNTNQNVDLEASINSSYSGTFDYYYKTNSKFNPFVGAGVGYTKLGNVKIENSNNNISDLGLESKTTFIVMGRIGFELGKLRMGLEYNYIPDSTIKTLVVGGTDTKIKNSYFAATIGFYVGGGKWNN